jgi:hypothetical protein
LRSREAAEISRTDFSGVTGAGGADGGFRFLCFTGFCSTVGASISTESMTDFFTFRTLFRFFREKCNPAPPSTTRDAGSTDELTMVVEMTSGLSLVETDSARGDKLRSVTSLLGSRGNGDSAGASEVAMADCVGSGAISSCSSSSSCSSQDREDIAMGSLL